MARHRIRRSTSAWRDSADGARRDSEVHEGTSRAARPSLPGRPTAVVVVRSGFGRHTRAAALAAALLYLVGISVYLLTHGGWPTPDYLIPPLLLVAIALGRGWPFVIDWAPFLLLILSWQATAGIADQFGRPVHMQEIVDIEMRLFGGRVPTVELQQRLFDPSRAHWYDWIATVQHALHFVLPVAVGLAVWLRNRRTYWRYLASVLVLFYLGFAGYALYPAAPPWMASLQDAIPPVHRVAVETVLRLPAAAPVGLAYTHFSANQVAAMPSLHAALPALLALVLIRLWGWRALPALLYPLAMGFNLVYLGEHYVVDVLAGYAVALLSYLVVWGLPDVLPVQLRITRRAPVRGRARVRPTGRRPVVSANGTAAAVPGGTLSARALHGVSNAALWAVAAASLVVVFSTLRPGRATDTAGPVVPGLQVEAGQTQLLAPVRCEEGASPSLTADNLLLPVTGRYAVYLFDIETAACYALSANLSFPPPRVERLPALVARAPVRLSPVPRLRLGVEHAALRMGPPMPVLVEAGLSPDSRYLLVVQLADVTDIEAAAAAVDELAALALVEQPGPRVPEPSPDGPEPRRAPPLPAAGPGRGGGEP